MTIIPTAATRFARFSLAAFLFAGGLLTGFAAVPAAAGTAPTAVPAGVLQDAGQVGPNVSPDQPIPVQLTLPPAGTEGWG